MSPIIFLMALTPLVKMMGKINCPGFSFNIPIPKSQDLPQCGATIQVLWEEDHSEEPKRTGTDQRCLHITQGETLSYYIPMAHLNT